MFYLNWVIQTDAESVYPNFICTYKIKQPFLSLIYMYCIIYFKI